MESENRVRPLFRKRKWKIRLIFLLVLLTGLWLASYMLEKKIKPFIIATISSQLTVPVTVDGIEFSLFRNFPSGSVILHGVTAMPAFSADYDTLLKAETVSVLVQWNELFSSDLAIRKIGIKNGILNLHIKADGSENYRIWKTDTTDSGNLELDRIILDRMQLNYLNERALQQLNCKIEHGDISAFIGDQMKIAAKTELSLPLLKVNDIIYLNKQKTNLHLRMDYDNKLKQYRFQPSEITVNGLKLQLSGNIDENEKYTDYDLKISSGKAGLKELIALIPETYSARWKEYKITGDASFQMSIKGKQQGNQQPLFTINFKAENGSMRSGKPEAVLSQIKMHGEYVSRIPNGKTDRLEIKSISASLNGKPVNGNMEITGTADPYLIASFSSEAALENISRFFMPDFLQSMSGDLVINNASFSGKLNDQKTHVSSGTVSIRNAAVFFREKPVSIHNIEASLKLEKNFLTVNHLSGNTERSDFAFSGNFKNLFGYLWNGSAMNMYGSLQSSMLDFNEILAKEKSESTDTIYRIRFADNFTFQLKLNVEQTRFNKFNATAITGSVSLNNNSFRADEVSFEAMNGKAIISGFISEIKKDSIIISADASLKQINIKEMFYQLGNFDQEVITDKHLKGDVTAQLKLGSRWSNTLECNSSSITAWSDISIENGELNDFAPMMALSKYLKGSDLNRIRFSTLKNTIEIKNRQVMIPQMEIKSSAAEVTLAGTHSFDNMIDYKMQLLLSQLVGKKVKSLNTEFGQIEDDQLGRTKLFLRLTGPAANPKISYDTKAVKEKVAAEFKKETQTVKELLKQEFGKNKEEHKRLPAKQKELEIEEDE